MASQPAAVMRWLSASTSLFVTEAAVSARGATAAAAGGRPSADGGDRRQTRDERALTDVAALCVTAIERALPTPSAAASLPLATLVRDTQLAALALRCVAALGRPTAAAAAASLVQCVAAACTRAAQARVAVRDVEDDGDASLAGVRHAAVGALLFAAYAPRAGAYLAREKPRSLRRLTAAAALAATLDDCRSALVAHVDDVLAALEAPRE